MIWNAVFALMLGLSMIVLTPFLPVSKLLEVCGKEKARDKFTENVSRLWARAVIRLTGSKVSVIGAENVPKGKASVFIANHQSYFDIPVILGYVPGQKSFIAKIETKKIPIFSLWMKHMHCVFMDRSNLKQSLESINKGIENLKRGYPVVIFPEGTRSHASKMGEFKQGSFRLATKTGLPVIPITIIDTYKVWEEKRHIRPSKIKVIISKPVETSSLPREELKAIPDRVYKIIEDNLKSENKIN